MEAIHGQQQVLTPINSLCFLLKHALPSISTPAQHFWVAKMLGYEFEIEYKAGMKGDEQSCQCLVAQFGEAVLQVVSMPNWLGWTAVEMNSSGMRSLAA